MSAYDKKPVFLIALALLVVCTSCGHDAPDVPPTPTEPDKPAAQIPINISATITRATEEAFESGDRIGLFVVNRNADGGKRERHAVRRQCRPEQSGRIQVVRPYRRLHARRRSIGIAGEHRGTSPDESGGDSAQGRCRI